MLLFQTNHHTFVWSTEINYMWSNVPWVSVNKSWSILLLWYYPTHKCDIHVGNQRKPSWHIQRCLEFLTLVLISFAMSCCKKMSSDLFLLFCFVAETWLASRAGKHNRTSSFKCKCDCQWHGTLEVRPHTRLCDEDVPRQRMVRLPRAAYVQSCMFNDDTDGVWCDVWPSPNGNL